MYELLPERMRRKIARTPSGCWDWTAGRNPKGYGTVYWQGKTRMAHRTTYEILIGPIPAGAHIDHRCRNTSCVNPEHLEPVLADENNRRAVAVRGPVGVALLKRGTQVTHCPRGHEYTPENTYTWRGKRRCRTCNRIHKGLTPTRIPTATHCLNGHEFTPENTYDRDGRRHCRACRRRRTAEHRARHAS